MKINGTLWLRRDAPKVVITTTAFFSTDDIINCGIRAQQMHICRIRSLILDKEIASLEHIASNLNTLLELKEVSPWSYF